jgi:hypothetical protein
MAASLVVGCSNNSPAPSPVDASHLDSGSAGADGSGGADGGLPVMPPPCLRALFAGCPTDVACTVGASDAGADAGDAAPASDGGDAGAVSSAPICYASGAKTRTAGTACTSGNDGAVTTVSKADGSLCYTFEQLIFQSHACEGGLVTWKDAAGATVATASFGYGIGTSVTVTCTASGQSTTWSGTTNAAFEAVATVTSGWMTPSCPQGSCP